MKGQSSTELKSEDRFQNYDYYQAGGCLSSNQQSYVSRQADEDLFGFLKEGFFCYVLTARQTGKSSLRVRTIDKLKQQGVVCATIDITSIGSEMSTAEQWYFSLLYKLARECDVDVNLEAWWKERDLLTYVNRFSEFVESVLLQNIEKPITIFIDEIDSLLSLDRKQFSTDDFFAAIRSFYNARADYPQFNRLTFALFGVASPDDLMRKGERTPFNIGQAIELTYFTSSEAEPLAKGLAESDVEAHSILNDILYWTNGHPYLTQKLCREIVRENFGRKGNTLKNLVDEFFLSTSGMDDPNLANINLRIVSEQKHNYRMLELYQSILTDGSIKIDDRDEAQIYLKLSGLVMLNQSGELIVSNRIYHHVFDLKWVQRTRDKINRFFSAYLYYWLESDKSTATLLQGDFLEEAVQWANNRNDLSHKEKDFLEASRSYEIEQAKALAIQQRKLANRFRTMTVALFLFFFLAVSAAMFAWNSRDLADNKATEAMTARDQAETQRQRAEHERLRAQQERESALKARTIAEQQKHIADKQKEQADAAKIRAENLAAAEQRARAEADLAKQIAENARTNAMKSEQARTENLFLSQITHSILLTGTGEFSKAKKILKDSAKLGSKIPAELRHSGRLLSWYANLFSGDEKRVYKLQNVPLNSVSLSPDGKYLITAGQDRSVALVDVKTGEITKYNNEHTDSIGKVVFLPDGKRFVSAGNDGRVILWSISKGLLNRWNLNGEVWALAVSPDGEMLAAGGQDKTITLIDIASGQVTKRLKGHSGDISAVAFSSESSNSILASASYDSTGLIWDTNTGKILTKLVGHSAKLTDIVFQPGDKKIATSSADRTVRLWRVDSGDLINEFSGHKNIVFSIVFSESGERLVSSSQDQTIRLWDIFSGETLSVFEGHTGIPFGLALKGNKLFSAADDGTLRQWQLNIDQGIVYQKMLQGKLSASVFSPDLSMVAIGFANGKIQLYSVPDLKLIWTQSQAHNDTVWRLIFSPDGKSIASVSLDNKLRLWNVNKGKKIYETTGSSGQIFSATFINGSRKLAITGNDGNMGIVDIEKNTQKLYPIHKSAVYSVFASPNGDKLLTAGQDKIIKLWQFTASSPKLIKQFSENVSSVFWAALSPDEKYIASGGEDKRLSIFSMDQTQPIQVFPGHKDSIFKTIFSPDSRQVATVGSDMSIRFWDLTTRSELFSINVSKPMNEFRDFDFRCSNKNQSNVCWVSVPLPNGLLKLYRINNVYH